MKKVMEVGIEDILNERRKDVKVVEHSIPCNSNTAFSVFEVQYATHSYDAVGHESTSWYSYSVFEREEVANYVAEAIARGIINIRKFRI